MLRIILQKKKPEMVQYFNEIYQHIISFLKSHSESQETQNTSNENKNIVNTKHCTITYKLHSPFYTSFNKMYSLQFIDKFIILKYFIKLMFHQNENDSYLFCSFAFSTDNNILSI